MTTDSLRAGLEQLRWRLHVLIAETRRCLDDGKYQTARRKLDAMDAELPVVADLLRAQPPPQTSKPWCEQCGRETAVLCHDCHEALREIAQPPPAPDPPNERRLKALKLLEAITEDCDVRTDGDHVWRKCRACLARFELDEKGPRELLRVVADLLRAQPPEDQPATLDPAVAPPPSDQMTDAAEMLWVVLANVSGGNWKLQSDEWQEAAARWRDNYFAALKAGRAQPPPAPDPVT